MKTTIYIAMLAAASLALSACADNEPRHTSVTTSETSTEVHRPVQNTTVETQQVRQY